MDLIPRPDQVVAALGNVAQQLLYGRIADLRRMPRTLIDDGPLREVYRYRPTSNATPVGDPVLLVTPLAAPATCFDLRRGCSLVEHLVTGNRPTYLVEYGEISFKDRNIGTEHFVGQVMPAAIKAVSEDAGGRPVHVVGWSVGGIFGALVAANSPELPIASLTIMGSPFDVSQVPMVAPLRPLLKVDPGMVTRLYRMLGGAPKPLVRRAFQLTSGTKLITKPLAKLQHLDDADWLAQIEAVDDFTKNMIAYPGRSFGQLYHQMLRANQLKSGEAEHEGSTIKLIDITAPTLVFAGNTDGIAPVNSVRAVLPHLRNAAEVRFEIVPGGHLGMLTGRAARETTWVVLDEWLDAHSTPDVAPAMKVAPQRKQTQAGKPAQKTTQKRTQKSAQKSAQKTTQKAAAKKASAKTGQQPGKKSAQKSTPKSTQKSAAKKSQQPLAPQRGNIGANPQRRYSSSGSRNLASKRPS